MSLVFKTPLNAKNLTSRGSQNIDSPIGCNLEEGSVEYNENGEYTLTPESADGFSSVEIKVDVPSDVNNQAKEATPTTSSQEITPDENYTGLSKVTIAGVTASIDANITAGNIKKDIEILGVTGSYDPQPDLETKSATYVSNGEYTITPTAGKDGISSATVTVEVPSDIHNQEKSTTPTTSSQEITADNGYSGLSKVTVSAVTAAIDANISAGNIKKDVEILGVTGNYDPQPDLEAKTVNSSTVQQVITPTAGKDGLSSVTVEPYVLQAKSATPTTSQQVIEPDNDKDGLSSVTVAAVTSAIDANIAAGNIKEGVTILGVQGTVQEGITPTGNINITDTTSTDVTNYATAQVVDANLAAGNIKSGVTILGISGSYDPQPNLDTLSVTPTTSAQTITPTSPVDGFNEVSVSAVTSAIDANIVAGNIKDGVTILGVTGTYSGGGGGTNVPDWSSIGFTSSETQYIVDEVAESALAKTTYIDQNQPVPESVWGHLRYLPTGVYEKNNQNVAGAYSEIMQDVTWRVNNIYPYYFSGMSALTHIGSVSFVNTSGQSINPTYLYQCFNNCKELLEAPAINTSSATNIESMFSNCWALTKINGTIDCSSVTSMYQLFYGCEELTTLPTITNSGSVTNMKYAFNGCSSLTAIPTFDTSNVTDMEGCFTRTHKITTYPALDTSKVTNMCSAFREIQLWNGQQNTVTFPVYDMSSVQRTDSMFYQSFGYNSTAEPVTFGGFTYLGKAFTGTNANWHTLDLSKIGYNCIPSEDRGKCLSKTSIMNIINALSAPDDSTCVDATLKLHPTAYALLDASDIAVATAKNWSVISA